MAYGWFQGDVPYLENRGLQVREPMAWLEALPGRPCPRCGATSGCMVSGDGRFVRCRLVVSEHPTSDGAWLHEL